eukprot:TRINITY_DN31145_c0_g1_i1.p1 TRINITY_DN31145_c0_g1~~TRINITY_DN31145_c0_g1_i1.p1  ORF type:complete len:489 (+),score=121.97 TRINITY_DN31145_c0_g1_i1:66-1532(+)
MSPLHHVSVKRRLLLLSISLIITIVYLFICGGVMMMLEKSNEEDIIEELAEEIAKVSLSNSTISHLEELGVCHFPRDAQWTFSGSVFYVLTVITTIGYGSHTPRTFNGKSFTVVFAIFGIALIGNILTNCAVLLVGIIQGILQRVRKKEVEKRKRSSHEEQQVWDAAFSAFESRFHENGCLPSESLKDVMELATNSPLDEDQEEFLLSNVDSLNSGYVTRGGVARALVLWYETQDQLPEGVSRLKFFIYIMVAFVWIITWACGFSYVESWEIRDGMWFCFVTMTTIGFGDFVPTSNTGRIMSFVFVVPGLGIGATALSSLWKAFDFSRFWWLQKAYTKGKVSKKLLEVHGILLPISTKNKVRKVKKKYRTRLRDYVADSSEEGTPVNIRKNGEAEEGNSLDTGTGESSPLNGFGVNGLSHPLLASLTTVIPDSPISPSHSHPEAIPYSKDSLMLSTPALQPSSLLPALPVRSIAGSMPARTQQQQVFL